MPTPKGAMTNEEMQAVHDAGGSVIYNGAHYEPGTALPTDRDLAIAAAQGGDASALDKSEADIDREIEALQAEKKRVADARKKQPEAEAKTEPKAEDKK